MDFVARGSDSSEISSFQSSCVANISAPKGSRSNLSPPSTRRVAGYLEQSDANLSSFYWAWREMAASGKPEFVGIVLTAILLNRSGWQIGRTNARTLIAIQRSCQFCCSSYTMFSVGFCTAEEGPPPFVCDVIAALQLPLQTCAWYTVKASYNQSSYSLL